MEMRSSGTLSDFLSGFVKHLIDNEDSSVATSVIQKSVIEKPTNDPCKNLPIVAGQDEIRLSQVEFVDPKSSRKSTETISSSYTRGGATKQRQRCRLHRNRSDRLFDRSNRLV